MKPAKQQYHHGDLYQSLIDASKEILQANGFGALSMRNLAEKTNVSRAAPYHHFKDKHALLCAIAEDGFLQQDILLAQIIGNSGEKDPIKGFEEFVVAYLKFAADNKEQYDLMYSGAIWKSGEVTPSLDAAAKSSFKLWLSQIEKLQQDGILKQGVSPLRLAQVTWATLHGLCRLSNDGIYVNPKDIDDMGRAAVKLLLPQ
ncbi:MAG: TetR/AcrR family transcriptional regulator [Gammaproteobacteria bacterium]|jgi:AcrR family transcriptional regulator